MSSTGRRYLIDSNVFIQAKLQTYRFEFCRGFWDWVEDAHAAGLVFSIDRVRAELLAGNEGDAARDWAGRLPNGFFVHDLKDPAVMHQYGKVISWSSENNQYTTAAKRTFARFDKADAFLIACAMHHDFCIVSHEKASADAKKRIPIPNAAEAMGVNCMQIFDLLTNHACNTFEFKL
ncbi:DUF4411 family protein [Propionivibrio sp.]|uniref:DUF4411 family protein n=1 Tax=Propionivibrio sp. TaxID=2212460 RepID=UPI00272EBDE8|nr:DUF4411 family protein [Propionivibrio sp.]